MTRRLKTAPARDIRRCPPATVLLIFVSAMPLALMPPR